MSASLLQETTPANDGGFFGTTLTTNAFGANATIGSTIEFWLAWEDNVVTGGSVTSVIDSAGQNYTQIAALDVTGGYNSNVRCFQFPDNQSVTKLTATIICANSRYKNIQLREIGGVTSAGADASSFITTTNPGLGADAITASATPSNPGPYLISAFSTAGFAYNTTPVHLVAGTGFTGSVAFPTGNGYPYSLFETKRSVTTGAQTATFTDATNGNTTEYIVAMIVYDELPLQASIPDYGERIVVPDYVFT